MKKLIKILVLLLITSTIFLIYNNTNKNNLIYLPLGDGLSLGENSYGGIDYSYTDYFKDYLREKKLLNFYTKKYLSKTKTIKDVYNDLLLDKNSTINKNSYTFKSLLREADIITISVGINDIIFQYDVNTYKSNIKIAKKVFNDYKKVIKELKKYYNGKIYVVGYYRHDTEYDEIIEILNNLYEEYSIKNKDIFISTDFVDKNKDYFDKLNSYYPNKAAYRDIGNKLIKRYEKEKVLVK